MVTNEFIEKARKVHGDKYDYSKVEYVNNKTKVCIICPEHGEFWQSPSKHLQGQGCPNCKKQTLSTKLKLTTKEFVKRAKLVHGDKYDYSKVEYYNSKTKVCIICPEHGEFWQQADNHLQGQGCPNCRCINIWSKRTDKLTTENFINRAKEVHGDKYDYSKTEYINPVTKVCIICPEHGEFWQNPYLHIRGEGCDICSHKTNISENKLINFIKNNIDSDIEVHKHFQWLGNKHLDVFIPDIKVGIEYQGEQHFKPVDFSGHNMNIAIKKYIKQQKNDYEKFLICKENGVDILYFTYSKSTPSNYFSNIYTNENNLLITINNYFK